jgi:HAD superfamily hydrolase (TIGR01509 family)
MIKAILMDFNGVIINDEPIQMRAYQEILKGEGIDLTEEDYYSALGMDDRRFVEAALKRANRDINDDKVGEITRGKTQKWREIVEKDLPLFDGIRNFVEKMSREFALGIVSMANADEIGWVLEQAGLNDHFSIVVSSKDVKSCKPDPECYRTGFRMLDAVRTAYGHLPITHRECLVIEDSPPGIQSAVAAGLPALGVTNTVGAEALRAAGAGAVATRLDDWMPDSIRRVFS